MLNEEGSLFKKILFTFLFVLSAYSLVSACYHLFEPENDLDQSTDALIIDYKSLNDYILSGSEGTIHYVLFYDKRIQDSEYVRNTLLITVQNDTQVQLTKIIEIADTSELDLDTVVLRLTDDWGIRSCPALAVIELDNGKAVVTSKLEWSSEQMLSAEDVEIWLIDNGLYQPGETMEPVETPE